MMSRLFLVGACACLLSCLPASNDSSRRALPRRGFIQELIEGTGDAKRSG